MCLRLKEMQEVHSGFIHAQAESLWLLQDFQVSMKCKINKNYIEHCDKKGDVQRANLEFLSTAIVV